MADRFNSAFKGLIRSLHSDVICLQSSITSQISYKFVYLEKYFRIATHISHFCTSLTYSKIGSNLTALRGVPVKFCQIKLSP